jgi:hypothetical protein
MSTVYWGSWKGETLVGKPALELRAGELPCLVPPGSPLSTQENKAKRGGIHLSGAQDRGWAVEEVESWAGVRGHSCFPLAAQRSTLRLQT